MRASSVVLLLVVAASVGLTGCAGTKRLEKEVEALRMQVNTLSSDISQLDAQQRDLEQAAKLQDDQMMGGSVVIATPVKGASGANIYRTPSGFTLKTTTLQMALKNAGYYTGPVDGVAGHGTKDSIRRFQADHSLKTDGVAGRKTWAKLKVYAK